MTTEVVVDSGREPVDRPKPFMLKFMRANRERIEQATRLKITQTDDKPYGCGGYGCAYATSDDKWTVKITSDPTEAALSKLVMDNRRKQGGGTGTGPSTVLPGIVFFDGVWTRPDEAGKPMFVIVRERVRAFQPEDTVAQPLYRAHIWSSHKYGATALAIANQYADDFYSAGRSEKKASTAITELLRWTGVLAKTMPLVAQDLRAFIENGLVIHDVHDYNVGYTVVNWGPKYRPPGSIVIFDLGDTPTNLKARYEKLNPVDRAKLEGFEPKRPNGKRDFRLDTRRAPATPTLHGSWLPPVKIPRLT